MRTPSAAILIHEPAPYWTPELQRQFVDEPVVVRGCAPITTLEAVRCEYATVVVLLDVTANPLAGLTWLSRRVHSPLQDAIIILAAPALADWEWMYRSAGATSFRTDFVTGRELARQCRKWLAEAVATAL